MTFMITFIIIFTIMVISTVVLAYYFEQKEMRILEKEMEWSKLEAENMQRELFELALQLHEIKTKSCCKEEEE